jgi:hypothetical protein
MAEPIQVGAAPKNGNKKLFIVLGVVVVLFLALRVLPGMLFGGDDGGAEVGEVTLPPATPGAPVSPATDEPVETVATFSSKNPFVPLVSLGGGGGGGDLTATPTPDVAVVEPIQPLPDFVIEPGADDGDGGVTSEPGSGSGDGAAPPTTAPPRQPDRVAMLELYSAPDGASAARVRVNDDIHEVRVGQDFAGRYRLTSVDMGTRCAQLLFGDERFTLCEGDETLK